MRQRCHLRRACDFAKSRLGARPATEPVGADADVEVNGRSGHSGGRGGFECSRALLRSPARRMPACRCRTAAALRRCARARSRGPETRTARPRVRRAEGDQLRGGRFGGLGRSSGGPRSRRRSSASARRAASRCSAASRARSLAACGCLASVLACLVAAIVLCLCQRRRLVGLSGLAAGRAARRRRFCGLARRQGNSANDFVGQLGIRIHDDLHRHVEIVALPLRLFLRGGSLGEQAQEQRTQRTRRPRA